LKFSTSLLWVADEFVPFIPVQVALGLDILPQSCAGAVEPDFDCVEADIENILNRVNFSKDSLFVSEYKVKWIMSQQQMGSKIVSATRGA
jgi:hypothetical protein